MKRSFKNLIRLISLALAMLLLSSCAGCDIVDFFDSLIPVGTDENGDPIIPGDEIEGDIGETGAGYVKKIDDKKYADWKDKISAVENTTEQEILDKYKESKDNLVQVLNEVQELYGNCLRRLYEA